jgi:hypothetical protein
MEEDPSQQQPALEAVEHLQARTALAAAATVTARIQTEERTIRLKLAALQTAREFKRRHVKRVREAANAALATEGVEADYNDFRRKSPRRRVFRWQRSEAGVSPPPHPRDTERPGDNDRHYTNDPIRWTEGPPSTVCTILRIGFNSDIHIRDNRGVQRSSSPPYLPDSDPENIVGPNLAAARQRYSEEAAHARRLTEVLTEFKPVTELDDPANLFPFVYRRQIETAKDAQENYSYWNSRRSSLIPRAFYRREWTPSPDRQTPPLVYQGPQRYIRQRARDVNERRLKHYRIDEDDEDLQDLDLKPIGFVVTDDQEERHRYLFYQTGPTGHEVVGEANQALWTVCYDPPFHFEYVGCDRVSVVHLPTAEAITFTLSEFGDALVDEYWPDSTAGECARKHFESRFDCVQWVKYLITYAQDAEVPLESDEDQ